ncbi:MAG: glycine cleavage system protein T, partial [Acidimicrobiia bacterium]|nr:glycine cleavage system protein T [Acidimicrobiia bacterium]
MPPDTRRSPLHDIHVALEAKMVPFGGWDMPLNYSAGTLAEHQACRDDAVVFDVSHLGTLRVTGPDAFDALQTAFTNDLHRIEPGRAQYTHLLDPDDASVLDDIIVWWVDTERFDVMPNASNTDRVAAALAEGSHRPEMADVTATRAVLAVQGPEARAKIAAASPEAAAVERFRVRKAEIAGVTCLVAGWGDTGVDDGMPHGAGVGARDTLRLEAGLPLHGNELGPGITTAQAGLMWVVRPEKGDFRGKAALAAE